MIWVNQVVQGVLLGGYYALLACGLSLMFGVMRIINLAHGDLAVFGGFAVWVLAAHHGISPYLALVVVLPAMAASAGCCSGRCSSAACAPACSRRS